MALSENEGEANGKSGGWEGEGEGDGEKKDVVVVANGRRRGGQ